MIDASSHYFTPPIPFPGYNVETLKIRRLLLANETLQKKNNGVVQAARKLTNMSIKATPLKTVLDADLLIIIDNLSTENSSRKARQARYNNKLPFITSPFCEELIAPAWGWSTSLWLPVHLFHFYPHRYLHAKQKGLDVGIIGYKNLPSAVNAKQVRVWLEKFLLKFAETDGLIWDNLQPNNPPILSSRKASVIEKTGKAKRKLKLKV